VALLPARGDGPAEQAERREDVARTREALRALKPAELRALTLLAEGYSYAEIADITSFSLTKINRCLAEGRERFRSILFSSESGDRCRELRPLISAFCDGEAGAKESALVREHLRACAHCRATMRTYRTAPRLASALVPMLPLRRSLLARAHELLSGFGSQIGMTKQVALCVGAAGSTAACMVTGVLPGPLGVGQERATAPTIERAASTARVRQTREDASAKHQRTTSTDARQQLGNEDAEPSVETGPTPPIEYAPPVDAPAPEPIPPPPPAPEATPPSGSAAGEFGP
jgi:Putative zinc-finger